MSELLDLINKATKMAEHRISMFTEVKIAGFDRADIKQEVALAVLSYLKEYGVLPKPQRAAMMAYISIRRKAKAGKPFGPKTKRHHRNNDWLEGPITDIQRIVEARECLARVLRIANEIGCVKLLLFEEGSIDIHVETGVQNKYKARQMAREYLQATLPKEYVE